MGRAEAQARSSTPRQAHGKGVVRLSHTGHCQGGVAMSGGGGGAQGVEGGEGFCAGPGVKSHLWDWNTGLCPLPDGG